MPWHLPIFDDAAHHGASARATCQNTPFTYKADGTDGSSTSSERLRSDFMPNFEKQVQDTLSEFDLLGKVTLTYSPEGELYIGSKLGLAGCFISNICDAVARAFSVTNFSHL